MERGSLCTWARVGGRGPRGGAKSPDQQTESEKKWAASFARRQFGKKKWLRRGGRKKDTR
ncbi:hypothetical protein IAQ61_006209 [Plenodomus lingam]|uniref:uncharacterized protein n=1 Tax=Leptosphaeria maculans TaxID=5022 RepID=UPI003329B656|nr:hypothetical protein IAQ61_006209 [Plenodomus lingam]